MRLSGPSEAIGRSAAQASSEDVRPERLWSAFLGLGQPPTTAMMVPFELDEPEWRWDQFRYAVGMVIDRPRIVELLCSVKPADIPDFRRIAAWTRQKRRSLTSHSRRAQPSLSSSFGPAAVQARPCVRAPHGLDPGCDHDADGHWWALIRAEFARTTRQVAYDQDGIHALRRQIPKDGASRTRTGDLLGAIQALSQLSYSPEEERDRARAPEGKDTRQGCRSKVQQ
jgi:hypothetical protein